MADLYITLEGKAEKEERLSYLRNVRRPEVIEKVKVAREYGDLSENSEYDAAKKEQSTVETEIAQIEETLRKAIIIDTTKLSKDVVSVGSTVKVYDIEFDESEIYKIVGIIECKPDQNFVSNESPIGKALLGSKVGDIVIVKAPMGDIQLKILEIL